LTDLDASRTQRLRALLATHYPGVVTGSDFASLASFDLVVNASPVGMSGHEMLPLPPEQMATLNAGVLVADVVTSPDVTRFLEVAREAGCRIQTGAEMALAQFGNLGAFMKPDRRRLTDLERRMHGPASEPACMSQQRQHGQARRDGSVRHGGTSKPIRRRNDADSTRSTPSVCAADPARDSQRLDRLGTRIL
jgi:hypothetical protein